MEEEAGEYLVLDGPEFRSAVLDDDGNIRQHVFDAVWRRLRVLARCSPADKFTIVKGVSNSTYAYLPRRVTIVARSECEHLLPGPSGIVSDVNA